MASAALGLIAPAGSAANAQGKVDARYEATLAGMAVGRGAWVIDIGTDKYLAAASGATAGIMTLFSSGEGTGAARGKVVNGQLMPASYAASISTSRRTNEVRFAINGGVVKDVSVSPPVLPESGRIPLTEAHQKGVIDPMTGSLAYVAGNGNPLVPSACQRTVPVFDGRMRYDMHLAYKRMDQVKAAKGYAGPALVCTIHFSPIAGYVPDRAAVKYLAELRTMEIWLVPIAGTSVLVPFRVNIPTPFGTGTLEATQFLTSAYRAKASTSGLTAQ